MRIRRPSEYTNRRNTTASRGPLSRRSRFGVGGFTMIEIAIAVGVIGFALVAIIGILPMGMSVQKDNREDTIISQDAPYFLNAIRNGEMRINFGVLTNYVESITVTNIDNGTNIYTYNNPFLTGVGTNDYLTNDMNIIGLLSTPEYDLRFQPQAQTNEVTAIVRAMSGSAIQQNGVNSATAFRYQLTVENAPWNAIAPDSTNYSNPIYVQGSPDYITRFNRYNEVPFLTNNLREVRLKFAWPVLPNGSIGPGRQTYRSLVSSHLGYTNMFNNTYWFFQPQFYTTNIYTN
jgi:type II secretory pathway pseudopilin PulG